MQTIHNVQGLSTPHLCHKWRWPNEVHPRDHGSRIRPSRFHFRPRASMDCVHVCCKEPLPGTVRITRSDSDPLYAVNAFGGQGRSASRLARQLLGRFIFVSYGLNLRSRQRAQRNVRCVRAGIVNAIQGYIELVFWRRGRCNSKQASPNCSS